MWHTLCDMRIHGLYEHVTYLVQSPVLLVYRGCFRSYHTEIVTSVVTTPTSNLAYTLTNSKRELSDYIETHGMMVTIIVVYNASPVFVRYWWSTWVPQKRGTALHHFHSRKSRHNFVDDKHVEQGVCPWHFWLHFEQILRWFQTELHQFRTPEC